MISEIKNEKIKCDEINVLTSDPGLLKINSNALIINQGMGMSVSGFAQTSDADQNALLYFQSPENFVTALLKIMITATNLTDDKSYTWTANFVVRWNNTSLPASYSSGLFNVYSHFESPTTANIGFLFVDPSTLAITISGILGKTINWKGSYTALINNQNAI